MLDLGRDDKEDMTFPFPWLGDNVQLPRKKFLHIIPQEDSLPLQVSTCHYPDGLINHKRGTFLVLYTLRQRNHLIVGSTYLQKGKKAN